LTELAADVGDIVVEGDDLSPGDFLEAMGSEVRLGVVQVEVCQTEGVEGKVVDGADRLRHQALAMVVFAEPEATILLTAGIEGDDADRLIIVLGFERDGPIVFLTRFHFGQCRFQKGACAVIGIGPRNGGRQILQDFPVGEDFLNAGRIIKAQRP
jgi:hypothetical protein